MNALRIQNVPAVDLYSGEIIFRPDRDKEETIKTEYFLSFPWLCADGMESESSAYSFPCDESGFIQLEDLTDCARTNLKLLLTVGIVNGQRYGVGRIVKRTLICRHRERSRLLCECGGSVYLGGFTNTCATCGADYNMSGSLLAPRSQWGEETGESVADILRADCAPDED